MTKLSLLLKVLEGETDETLNAQMKLFHERALPDLEGNIKCGNSLIGPDFYDGRLDLDEEERRRINAFDWRSEFPQMFKQGGFDVVIGNPPYDVMEKERRAASWPHTALADYVKTHTEYEPATGGKLNLFRFFVVRSLLLTRINGRYGMIVPLALLADISCARTRRHLMLSARELLADCFPQKDNANERVFYSAKLSTVVLTCARHDKVPVTQASITVRVYPRNKFEDRHRASTIPLAETALIDPENTPIPLVDAAQWSTCRGIHSAPNVSRLGEVRDFSVTRGEINQTIYREYIFDNPRLKRLVKGVEIGRFRVRDRLSQGHREWFDERRFLLSNTPRPMSNVRRIATQRITGVDEKLRIVATLIDPPAYFADSTNSVVLLDGAVHKLEYLLGLLNSTLFQWRFKLTSTNNNVGTNELESMPFRTIDFTDPRDRTRHDRMVALVAQMLQLHQSLAAANATHDKTLIQRRIDATDRQIDSLVYELYGLAEDEIAIVEGTTSVRADG